MQQLSYSLEVRTLQQAFVDYLASRVLSPISQATYRRILIAFCGPWLSMPLSEITEAMISERQKHLTRTGKKFTSIYAAKRLLERIQEFEEPVKIKPQQQPRPALASATCETLTLRRIWADYQQSRNLAAKTLSNYTVRLRHLSDWLDIPAVDITADMVEHRHKEIGTHSGHSMANSTMRTLRSLLYYAEVRYTDERKLPLVTAHVVKRLTVVRAWYKDKRRKTCIPIRQLPAVYRAICSLDSMAMRDFYLLLLFTGARTGELRKLKWSDVDLGAGVMHFRDTKTGEDPTIPLSDYTWNLLLSRSRFTTSDFVFPGLNPDTPVTTCWGVSKDRIEELSGVKFCPHDFRRLFITIGDELDMRPELVKALVGHVQDGVHEDYVIRSVERLRRASQQITDAILSHAGVQRLTPKTITIHPLNNS